MAKNCITLGAYNQMFASVLRGSAYDAPNLTYNILPSTIKVRNAVLYSSRGSTYLGLPNGVITGEMSGYLNGQLYVIFTGGGCDCYYAKLDLQDTLGASAVRSNCGAYEYVQTCNGGSSTNTAAQANTIIGDAQLFYRCLSGDEIRTRINLVKNARQSSSTDVSYTPRALNPGFGKLSQGYVAQFLKQDSLQGISYNCRGNSCVNSQYEALFFNDRTNQYGAYLGRITNEAVVTCPPRKEDLVALINFAQAKFKEYCNMVRDVTDHSKARVDVEGNPWREDLVFEWYNEYEDMQEIFINYRSPLLVTSEFSPNVYKYCFTEDLVSSLVKCVRDYLRATGSEASDKICETGCPPEQECYNMDTGGGSQCDCCPSGQSDIGKMTEAHDNCEEAIVGVDYGITSKDGNIISAFVETTSLNCNTPDCVPAEEGESGGGGRDSCTNSNCYTWYYKCVSGNCVQDGDSDPPYEGPSGGVSSTCRTCCSSCAPSDKPYDDCEALTTEQRNIVAITAEDNCYIRTTGGPEIVIKR